MHVSRGNFYGVKKANGTPGDEDHEGDGKSKRDSGKMSNHRNRKEFFPVS